MDYQENGKLGQGMLGDMGSWREETGEEYDRILLYTCMKLSKENYKKEDSMSLPSWITPM